MSYAATATPPGGRSSINKFISQLQTPSVQQLYLDAVAARVAEDEQPPAVHSGHLLGAPSRSGSCLDLATLPKLLEGSAGEHEGARQSDAELEECSTHPQGRMLAGFYQRQNAILDSWQEVDEILFSPFPDQVLDRFISKDQMRQISERKTLQQKVSLVAAGLPSQIVVESDSESEHSPTVSPVSFSAPRKRNLKRAVPSGRQALSTERKHLLDDNHKPTEPSSNYGSFTDREGLTDCPNTHVGDQLNTTDAAPTNDKLDAPFTRLPRSHDMTVEMSNDSRSARSSLGLTTNHVDNTHVAVNMDDDDDDDAGLEAGSSADDENDTDDDSCRRHTPLASARPLSAAYSPDGKRESERQRLMSHVPGITEKDETLEKQVQFAISINLATNVALLMGKVLACLSTSSVSLIASLVDSALDLLSTLIIFATSKMIAHRSFQTVYKYPVGKRRFEPLGVVIFSVLMIASFLQVLLESSGRLWACLHGEMNEIPSLPLGGIGMMLITVVLKAIMWIKYRTSPSSGVRAVAQGQALSIPELDPLGGILLSLYIIREWSITLVEQVTKLSGKACGSQEIARALYLVTRFKDVQSISNLEVYHAGDGTIIEADVVLPYDLSLKEAHDVGEVLTFALECLPDVERAYVHLDYNAHGPMGHLAQRG